MGRRAVLVGSLALSWALSLLSTSASAHGVGSSKFDAPVPLPFLFAGAAATIALTALLVGAVSEPTTDEGRAPAPTGAAGASEANASGASAREASTSKTNSGGRTAAAPARESEIPVSGRVVAAVPPSVARGIRLGAQLGFLAFFVGAILAGLFGTQTGVESPTTTFVWPVWIKGVGLYAVLLGSPWAALAPWRTLYAGLCRLDGTEISLFDSYPGWLGFRPALVGFVVLVGILEPLTIVPRSPRLTAAVIAGYGALMIGGAVLFGRRWLDEADAFAVLYGLLGRVAPVRPHRTDAGGYRIALRAPWRGPARSAADLTVVAFAVATVYTVSFDGFTSTPEFQRLLFGVRDALGVGGVVSLLYYLVGLCVFVGLFVAVSWVMQRAAGSRAVGDWRPIARVFAPTVLPIAAAYELAHNYPYALGGLGALPARVESLVANAAADPITPLGWLSVEAFWYSQVLLIVCGHAIAVIAAHRVALAYGEDQRDARRLHAPLVALMIGYTVLSLWIVSRPVVAG
jgi:hypothetical protein